MASMLVPEYPCSRNRVVAAARMASRLAGSLGRPGPLRVRLFDMISTNDGLASSLILLYRRVYHSTDKITTLLLLLSAGALSRPGVPTRDQVFHDSPQPIHIAFTHLSRGRFRPASVVSRRPACQRAWRLQR